MKKRDDFTGMQKLYTLENFDQHPEITNRKLKDLALFMESKGYTIINAENPTQENEGLLEFSKTTYAILCKDGTFYGGIDLEDGRSLETQPTKNYDKLVEDLRRLKIKNKLSESDYTTEFDSTKPMEKTDDSIKKRYESVKKALEHLESGLNLLKNTPKLDWMSDIPSVISELENLLGDEKEQVGLRNLVQLYKKELKK